MHIQKMCVAHRTKIICRERVLKKTGEEKEERKFKKKIDRA